jgi:hypothetical protein
VVIDLPDAVAEFGAYYKRCNLVAYGLDISRDNTIDLPGVPSADLVISSEIVEHLPKPPSEHFASLRRLLADTGALLVATPNAGSLRSTLKTLLHQPVLPPAERTFGPVNLENEGVHRREYMASEIVSALRRSGFSVGSKGYVNYNFTRPRDLLFLPVEALVPYFRQGLIMIGKPSGPPHQF